MAAVPTIDRPEAPVTIPPEPGRHRRRGRRLTIGVVMAGLVTAASILVPQALDDSSSKPAASGYARDWKGGIVDTAEAPSAYTGDWKDSVADTTEAQLAYKGDWKDGIVDTAEAPSYTGDWKDMISS
jgi:hypothetical protein